MSTAISSRRPKKAHKNEDEVRAVLLQVALEDGSAHRAMPGLQEKGIKVSESTVKRWRDTYADLYLEIRDGVQGVRQRKHAAEMEDAVSRGIEITRRYWERADEVLPELPARDVPGSLRNLGVTLGIQTQRTLELRERPVVMPPEKRSPEEIIAALERKGLIKQVEPPVVDAEVVEEP